jgi:hypothetical protein
MAAGTANITVTAPTGCPWTAATNAGWINLGASSATGNLTFAFTYQANLHTYGRSATITVAGTTLTVTQAAGLARGADFNADGRNDILWQNHQNGAVAIWRMNGTTAMVSAPLGPGRIGDLAWKIVGSADLNRDGQSDIIWQHDLGYLAVWFMRGEALLGAQVITATPVNPAWRVAATGDLNGDGFPDLIWQHQTGPVAVWYMNGTQMIRGEIAFQPGSGWRVAAAADFNLDGRLDLVWRNAASGRLLIGYLNVQQELAYQEVNATADSNWEVLGITDVDSNTRPDLLWRHRTNGALAVWMLNGAALVGASSLNPGAVSDMNWTIVGPR